MKSGTKIALGLGAAVLGALGVTAFARYITKARFLAALPPAGVQYGELVWRAAKAHGIDPTLLAAVISHESGFGEFLTPKGPRGTSGSGDDLGLAQISKKAWADWAATHDWGDPAVNIDKGAEILAASLAAFPGNTPAGIAAYNAGPSNVKRALAAGKAPGDVTTHDAKGRDYVQNVVAQLDKLQRAAA